MITLYILYLKEYLEKYLKSSLNFVLQREYILAEQQIIIYSDCDWGIWKHQSNQIM